MSTLAVDVERFLHRADIIMAFSTIVWHIAAAAAACPMCEPGQLVARSKLSVDLNAFAFP